LRLRQGGTERPFWKKRGSASHVFSKTNKIKSYAVGILFWSVGWHKTRFACGSMVHVFSVAQKNSQREFFCATDRACSALPEPALSVVEWGDIPRQT
jgi:hypothetical protein